MDINTLAEVLTLIELHKAKMTMASLPKGNILITIVAHGKIDQFQVSSTFYNSGLPQVQVEVFKNCLEGLKLRA
jgi:hypothetical protein